MTAPPDAMAASASPGEARPFFSLCIPAYNRAEYLPALLESIDTQDFDDLEIVVSEDASPQRAQIGAIVAAFAARSRLPVRYSEVVHNLGYDGNLRRLVSLARGRYCFFMGNDDVLAPRALEVVARHLRQHPGVGMLLRGYSWFRGTPEQIVGTVRYTREPLLLAAGREAIATCFRRSGVISGYVIDRDGAAAAVTDRFDGTLYYQMHLTASVLRDRDALVVPEVTVLCRDEVPPDFGVAAAESGRYTPGRYTWQARVHMLEGAMSILAAHEALGRDGMRRLVARDYARHFYPFVMDQLHLPWRDYLRMCRAMARTPVGRFPSFWINCLAARLVGRRRTDALIAGVRAALGRTPQL